ncbi:MAG TPA: cob(I)yrinic acid a,c-diamide adenosyltransferase [Tepidisphaeraceae bacterium]|nr:cob(I)yrinic acid a,c-diamide adenosyltransferase [Tepidisphaeraceae bacterium]
MKIYTKAGDDGSTGLIGGHRVRKCDARIDCVGAVDEVNAALGWCAVGGEAKQASQLRHIQNDLFVIGSHLALADGATAGASLPPLDESIVSRLEMEIDAAERGLAPLRNFILPGGTEAAARLHLARTICRRAERRVVGFALDRPVPTVILTYLNRLSDWLFVQARHANQQAGIPDVPWEK